MLAKVFRIFRSTAAGGSHGDRSIAAAEVVDVPNRVDGTTLFGLITFRSVLKSDRDPAEAALHVRFGSASAVIPGSEVADRQSPGHWRVQFNVNSHLVQD